MTYFIGCSVLAFPLALIGAVFVFDHAAEWRETWEIRRATFRSERRWRQTNMVWLPATVQFPADPSPRRRA